MSGVLANVVGVTCEKREVSMSKLLFCPEAVGVGNDELEKLAWVARSLELEPPERGRLVNVITVHHYLERRGVARLHFGDGITAEPVFREAGFPTRRVTISPPAVLAFLPLSCAVDEIGRYVVPGEGPPVVGSLAASQHHSSLLRDCGDGVFNHLAQAAYDWIADGKGAGRSSRNVLILDLDADCGSGTEEIIRRVPGIRQIDVAVDACGAYESSETSTLRVVNRASDYLGTITELLERIPRDSVSLCLYSAGVACHERGPSGLAGITSAVLAERDKKIFRWAWRRRIPLAYVVGDGAVTAELPRAELIELHRQTAVIGAKTSNLTR